MYFFICTQGMINCENHKLFSKFPNFLLYLLWRHFLTGGHIDSRVEWENLVSTQSQKITLLFYQTVWDMKVISYIVWHLKLPSPFKSFTAKSQNIWETMRKIGQFYRPPVPKVAIFFSVDANNFLKVSDFWFWDAARHNNDDNIKIRNALIWVLQDLS